MAEGRILKRRICESKKLGELQTDSARLLYTWLIPWLDIEGRYSADPDILKGHIFPKIPDIDRFQIEADLIDLKERGLILLYEGNGEYYLQFKQTLQVLRRDREAQSTIPPPPGPGPDRSGTGPAQVKLSKDKLSNKEKEKVPLKGNQKESRIKNLLKDREQEFIEPWNTFAEQHNLPRIQDIKSESTRYRQLRARLREGLEFEGLLAIIEASPFLIGQTKAGFHAAFDWIIKPSNYQKIMEGNYLDRNRRHSGLQAWLTKGEERRN